MINQKENYVAWALLIEELDDAHEHLGELIKAMVKSGCCEEEDFSVRLGHVYAHLNRAWHSRSQTSETTSEQWDNFSQFPKDLKPVG